MLLFHKLTPVYVYC